MERKTKSILIYITFGVLLYAAAMNYRAVFLFLREILSLIFPILLGMLMAFILNVPMRGIEKRLKRLTGEPQQKAKKKLIRAASLLTTLAVIILLFTLAGKLVVPELVKSAKTIYPLVKAQLPEWAAYLERYELDLSLITQWLKDFDLEQLSGSAGNVLGSAVNLASSTISGVVNVVFATVIAIYTLLSKDTLNLQTKKIIYANLSASKADAVCNVARLVRDTYTKFLSGQCIEAIILGTLIFVAFTVFRLPYASMIGFLTGLFAFIPYVGSWLACLIGAFLTLLVSPHKVIIGIIVYLSVQFVENQFIYPNVVGSSVGLTPLLTLIAALIGGKLFGIPGIVFFIPLAAACYQLLKENTDRKLEEKRII